MLDAFGRDGAGRLEVSPATSGRFAVKLVRTTSTGGFTARVAGGGDRRRAGLAERGWRREVAVSGAVTYVRTFTDGSSAVAAFVDAYEAVYGAVADGRGWRVVDPGAPKAAGDWGITWYVVGLAGIVALIAAGAITADALNAAATPPSFGAAAAAYVAALVGLVGFWVLLALVSEWGIGALRRVVSKSARATRYLDALWMLILVAGAGASGRFLAGAVLGLLD